MPNTLAHFGIQGVVSRGAIPRADCKWVLLGCVIPDLPWIIRRAVITLVPNVDPYGLRLYGIAQASLMILLLLCGALALLSQRPRQVFLVLSFNALLHLVLDALQTKWGLGVHLFAPFTWEAWNAALFWPDSTMTYTLTAGGVVYFVWAWMRPAGDSVGIAALSGRGSRAWFRLAGALVLFVAFFLMPFFLRAGPLAADNQSVKTLLEEEARLGRFVQFDRGRYEKGENGDLLFSFAGEGFVVTGEQALSSGRVSARATFTAQDTIFVHALHEHIPRLRDFSSYFGLLLLLLVWVRGFAGNQDQTPDLRG